MELGISLAVPNYRTVCYVEREAYAAATLVARMEDKALDPAPVWDDLTTFDGRPWRGIVDIISAGIPCQPYSVAGKQKGHKCVECTRPFTEHTETWINEDGDTLYRCPSFVNPKGERVVMPEGSFYHPADERALWPEFVRIVGECRPALVFIENVPAFAKWFREPGEQLCRLGYEIEEPLFLAAEDVGAPHKRERVFILAHAMRSGGPEIARGPSGNEEAYGGARRDGGQSNTNHLTRSDVEGVAEPERGGCGQGDGPAGSEGRRRQPESEGRELADAEGTGRSGHTQPNLVNDGLQPPYSHPLFPPGPSDLDLWARVLAEAPTLEPAVCKLANGAPYRVDQLRALGNAVVPIQSAVAFLTLIGRITE